jgi:hypothetical protein
MSNNASSDSDVYQKPGNPQETLETQNFYYSGLCSLFLETYPLQHKKQRERMEKLNDYTQSVVFKV